MPELDDIQPVDDPPQSTLACPVCRNGVAVPPEFNLPSVQCPTCGSVFGRLTGQVIAGPMMQAGPYRSPVSLAVSTGLRGAAPLPRGGGFPMAPRPAPKPASRGKILGVSLGTILAFMALAGVRYGLKTWLREDREFHSGGDYADVPTKFDIADFEPDPTPTSPPITQWHPYRDETWKFRCQFPVKPGASRKDDATGGQNLQLFAEDIRGEYSVECIRDPELAARIASNPRDHAVALAARDGDAEVQTGQPGEVDSRASFRVDVAVGDRTRSVLVVADGENVFVLRCTVAKDDRRLANVFFSTFRFLKPKLGAANSDIPNADRPLALYFIGNGHYTPGSSYNAVLVARNGADYTWEVLEDSLPEGIKATVNGDRVEVKGASTLDTGGTLKVRVSSGGESTEYELILRASARD